MQRKDFSIFSRSLLVYTWPDTALMSVLQHAAGLVLNKQKEKILTEQFLTRLLFNKLLLFIHIKKY